MKTVVVYICIVTIGFIPFVILDGGTTWVTNNIWGVEQVSDHKEDISKCNIYHTFRNVGIDHPEVKQLMADYKQACERIPSEMKANWKSE